MLVVSQGTVNAKPGLLFGHEAVLVSRLRAECRKARIAGYAQYQGEIRMVRARRSALIVVQATPRQNLKNISLGVYGGSSRKYLLGTGNGTYQTVISVAQIRR